MAEENWTAILANQGVEFIANYDHYKDLSLQRRGIKHCALQLYMYTQRLATISHRSVKAFYKLAVKCLNRIESEYNWREWTTLNDNGKCKEAIENGPSSMCNIREVIVLPARIRSFKSLRFSRDSQITIILYPWTTHQSTIK